MREWSLYGKALWFIYLWSLMMMCCVSRIAVYMAIALGGWAIFGIGNERRMCLLYVVALVHNVGRACFVFGRGAGVGDVLLCPSCRAALYRMRSGRRS